MKPWRGGLVLLMGGLLVAAACSSSEGDDDDGTSAGSMTGTTTGTAAQTGTATGTGGATTTGGGTATGADPCEPGSGLSPEERFRATCVMTVAHADWGQCASDPAAADATAICDTQEICASCPYLWYPNQTYDAYAACLGELAVLRCCLLLLPDPFACTPEDFTAFADVSADQQCTSEYDSFTTCMTQ